MRLSSQYQFRITPDIKRRLDHLPEGTRAKALRNGLDLYFSIGHVVYEVSYVSRNVKYFGIAETRDYYDCGDYLTKLCNTDVEIGKELMIHPLSEFDIRVVGVFARLEEGVRFRDWCMNDWLNRGGGLYNEYERGFKRTLQVSLAPEKFEKLLVFCKKKKITVQKLIAALMSKFL